MVVPEFLGRSTPWDPQVRLTFFVLCVLDGTSFWMSVLRASIICWTPRWWRVWLGHVVRGFLRLRECKFCPPLEDVEWWSDLLFTFHVCIGALEPVWSLECCPMTSPLWCSSPCRGRERGWSSLYILLRPLRSCCRELRNLKTSLATVTLSPTERILPGSMGILYSSNTRKWKFRRRRRRGSTVSHRNGVCVFACTHTHVCAYTYTLFLFSSLFLFILSFSSFNYYSSGETNLDSVQTKKRKKMILF